MHVMLFVRGQKPKSKRQLSESTSGQETQHSFIKVLKESRSDENIRK